MKRIRKLVASLVIMGMGLQMLPVRAMASEVLVNPPNAWGAVPSTEQIQYHEEELAAFIHFGMNTFTNSEWGNGRENPNSFNPTDLDPMQWVKTLKEAGFKRLIMVGKHHDGFAIWQSEYTEHDVANSTDWQKKKGGTGDVLEEVSKACTYYDMDMGIYLSPWDANATSYGYGTGTNEATDSNGDYNEYYMNQLREILDNEKYGNNGKFVEVWMDGAKGSGAAAQHYKFKEWFDLIEELQPGAVVFSPYGTAVRWIGNESGIAGDPVWSKINYSRIVNRYDAGLGEESGYLNSGDANGDIWSVGECDVSLTSGWFWHNGNTPKTMEQLSKIYFSSVGRGQPLLLNVAPDNRGKFTDNDIARIKEFGDAVKNTFNENLVDKTQATVVASSVRGNSDDYSANKVIDNDKDTYWTMDDGQTTGNITIDLGGEKTFDIVSIEEYIKLGQRISKFKVEVLSNGNWKDFGSGYTIGAKRLVRGTSVKASKVRITVEESLAVPLIENVEVYKADKAFAIKSIAPEGTDFIDNVNFDNKNSWTQENIGIGNTGMYSGVTGNHTSFTFTGSKAWVIGTFDPSHGIMEVWVDDKKVTDVDTYKATRAISQILYETEDLDYGTHTVKVVVKGEKNSASRGNAIGIDGGYYLNNNGAGMFEIEKGNYTLDEGKTQELTIKRVGGSVGEATVHFSTSPGSAVHGRHYNDVNKTIEFADGQTTAKVTIESIDNNEKSGDLKFYCNLDNPSNGAILGFNNTAEVTIKDNDTDTEYTVENPFVMPSNLGEGKLLEAELFTLDPITGTKYVRISEDSKASNGKMVTWFETGNKIKVPFYASKAGTYTFKMSYQSGRSDGNLNKVNWSGTNIVSGSKSVPGTGNQNPVPIITTSFDVEVSKAGPGELIFTADSQSSPNIDVFEVTAKELVKVTHTITATAGENGTINPAGVTTLKEGESITFTFTPDNGYEVEDVLVDNVSVGAVNTYIVNNISKDMNISIKFKQKNIVHGEENPIILSKDSIIIEAEKLELDGVGGEIENKDGANGGKLVGWLGLTSRGNAWLNMWVNPEEDGLYDLEVRYFSGSNDTLYYENIDKSVSGSLECDKTDPNFETKTIRVSLKKGLDKIRFFNDTKSTANIDTIKISKVVVNIDKTELNEVIANSEALDLSKYTPSSLEKFNEALNSAKVVATNENATQEEVNKAIESLKDAISNLVTKVDKSVLGMVVDYAENAKLEGALENVVPVVANEFEAALLEAKAILEDENSSEATVDLVIKRLINVIHMLEFKKGDKAELIKLVEIIEALEASEYTSSTWNLLKIVLESSKGVIANENAMKEEVTTTYEKLIKAFLDLRLKPSKEKLEGLIKEAEKLDSTKYTEITWKVLERELLKANEVIANDNATYEEIANSEKALDTAIKDLVAVSSDNDNNDNDNSNNDGNDNGNNNDGNNNGNDDDDGDNKNNNNDNDGNNNNENNSSNTNNDNNNSNNDNNQNNNNENSENNNSNEIKNNENNNKLPSTGGTSSATLILLGLVALCGGIILKNKK